jgi:putative alpha-1,2-mannosidase
MSGAGCHNYGDVPFLPVTGTVPADKNAATVGIDHAKESAGVGYYSLTLNNGVRTELTSGRRAAMGRFTFPAGQQATLLGRCCRRRRGLGRQRHRRAAPRSLDPSAMARSAPAETTTSCTLR